MRTIGGIPIGSTGEAFSRFSRFAGLVWAETGAGKTTLISTLDELCQKHMGGKRLLVIGLDEGNGSGTESIRDKDIPLVEPKTLNEVSKLMAELVLCPDFGAVVVDDGTSFATKYVQPRSLELKHARISAEDQKLRDLGVPVQGDYLVMGEFMREFIINLIKLSTFGHPKNDPEKCDLRKHVFMTAQQRVKTDRSGENIVYIGPAFPGSLPPVVCSKFPLVCTIKFGRDKDKNPIRYVQSSSDSPKELLKDRSGLLPRTVTPDICSWYEEYWIPEMEKLG